MTGYPPARPGRAGTWPPGGGSLAGLTKALGADAERLLIGASVYREPADRSALLFQVGQHDWAAARAPDRPGLAPPYQEPPDLGDMIAACQAAGLLIVGFGAADRPRHASPAAARPDPPAVFVDRWTASELHRALEAANRGHDLAAAHLRAAKYWRWRSAAWPQERHGDLHDLLEARHHLLKAGEIEQACELTEAVCSQLHAWGDLGREAALISDTLTWLPAGSARSAAWIHELGTIAQVRADYAEAERCYQRALDIFATVGDRSGVSRSYHSLGVLAQAQGDYATAELRYQRAAAEPPDPADLTTIVPPTPGPQPGPIPPTTTDPADASLAGPAPAPAADPASASPDGQAPPPPPGPASTPSSGPQPAPSGDPEPASLAGPALASRAVPRTAAHAAGPPWTTAQPPAPTSTPTAALAADPPRAIPQLPASASTPAAPATAEPPRGTIQPAAAGTPAAPRHASAFARVGRPTRWRMPGLTAVSVALLALSAAGITGAFPSAGGASISTSGAMTAAAALSQAAAAWVAGQVSRSAIVACDPAMCTELQASGFPAGDLLVLGPAAPDPLGSDVVVSTTAVRSEFGDRLADVYAPVVLARFGSGAASVEVRVVAPDGAAAYRGALAADLVDRQHAGAELLGNSRLSVPPPAGRELAEGLVDSRLLATLAALTDLYPVRVLSFGRLAPGASAGVPLRSVAISAGAGSQASAGPKTAGRADAAADAAYVRSVVGFLRAQRAPYLAAVIRAVDQPGGQASVFIGFASPSPLGLLSASPAT